jgi:hypothetical protein
MENEHIIGALTRKRAEIVRLLSEAEKTVRALNTDLGHVDATLGMFDPSRAGPGRAKRTNYADLAASVMEALRQAAGALSVRQIVETIMAKRGLLAGDRPITRDLLKRVAIILRHLRTRGTAVSERGQGAELVWRVV